ncbi:MULTISPECIES: hypothetical protein [Nostocales]|uniref:Uncharacterized protein n=1 Tax=Tolypothrix bouteillei VB521301 TaxID=1479485 RepID=A0A0C1N5K1_9CYAN
MAKLRAFQRQALIERLARRFAELNGYDLEPDVTLNDTQNPQLQIWLAMAEVAVKEVEKEMTVGNRSEAVQNFLSKYEGETHTGQEWESLAFSEGLDEDEIDELMKSLDDSHYR